MLTDEELTERLEVAFRATTLELEYTGRVPRVRRAGGLAATAVLAVATALALTPAALQRDANSGTATDAAPGTTQSPSDARRVTHTLDLGPLRLAYSTVAGAHDQVFLVIGPDLTPPPDAEKVSLDLPADVWFAADPQGDDPQVYVRPFSSTMTYGILAPGWTRQQLIDLLEHPLSRNR